MMSIQMLHSIEELSNKFNVKFPLFKMSSRFFLYFEILFFLFWLSVLLITIFPYRNIFMSIMSIFILLMFVNGLWHVVWWGINKKYVPGLFTEPFYIVVFIIFYFQQFI